jgi:hypothetical protein
MKVKLHNDGKEKNFSFDAMLTNTINPIGYGANDAEAIAELKKSVDRYIKELQSIDYNDVILVDWNGNPIQRSGAV